MELVMKYKSCHLIEHGISIDVDSIKACCLSRDFDKGQLLIVPKYINGKIDWNTLFRIKKEQRKFQKGKDLPACEGCYNLREEEWDEEDYISYINFDHWSQCNSNCIYCGVQATKPKTKNNILGAIKDLIKICMIGKEDECSIVLSDDNLLDGVYYLPIVSKIYIAKAIEEDLFKALNEYCERNNVELEVISGTTI